MFRKERHSFTKNTLVYTLRLSYIDLCEKNPTYTTFNISEKNLEELAPALSMAP